MKGYVYVISNPGMPGLVKVGFSMKDPELRAQELNHTGTPHPYVVDYWVLVENPEQIEQRAHRAMKNLREGKEWFRCSREEAVVAIQTIVGAGVLLEEFPHADREKAKEIRRMRELEENRARQELERAKMLAEEKKRMEDVCRQEVVRIKNEHKEITEKYEEKLKKLAQRTVVSFWKLWVAAIPLLEVYFVIVRINLNRPPFDFNLVWGGIILSIPVAVFAWLVTQGWWYCWGASRSEPFRSLLQERDSKLKACRQGTTLNLPCGETLNVSPGTGR